MLTVGSLCSGFGGLDLAAGLALGPVEHRWVAENDPAAATVLAAHWPDTPNLGDLTATDFTRVDPVDLLVAGYPCQGESLAGRRGGAQDERWLWPHVFRAVRVVRPRLVLLENVPGHLSMGFGRVLADLASIGYVGSWLCLPAAAVGAPHKRERVFIAAYPANTDRDAGWLQPVAEPRSSAAAGARAAGSGGQPVLPTPTAADGDRTSGTYARGNPTLTGALMPTPGARLGDGRGAPSVTTAGDRVASGRRNLDDTVALLPTPTKSDTTGAGRSTVHGMNLRTAAALLPTPAARDHKGPDQRGPRSDGAARTDLQRSLPGIVAGALLPTPRATDGTKGSPNQHGSSGDLMLTGAVMQHMLLPTPTAEGHHARNATVNRNTHSANTNHAGWTLADVAYAERWGRYADAIARWERVTGRAAPDPTEPGRQGRPRLAPAFVEWMMGLPEGWVTGPLTGRSARNNALRILGNGVVPAQGALAYSVLLRQP